ncbi:PBP1A family penicillin-binding protein [Fictibacillus iocasae]|uniref:PBP1A family penicillin-binding protein n=1 Tax=Fictibacillus iocasae TaxID=2715437 RepID=A0ABW2NMN1_9BACL
MSKDYQSRQERRKSLQDSKPAKKKKRTVNWKRTAIAAVLIFGLLSVLTVGAIAATSPKLDPKKLETPVSSKIYDMNGEEVSMFSGSEKRIKVKINEVPPQVQNAFIATEDVRFRKHFGVDIRRLFGATLANVKEGFGAEGASTITQQVVKNTLLTDEKSLTRKIREAYLAIQLEQKYSKDQILEMYLNKIFFGQGAWGVATASKVYFDKELDELEVHEAALLAGLPKAPSTYNPFENPEQAEQRRNVVLSLMEKHGLITKEEAQKAKNIPVKESLREGKVQEASKYDAYLAQVAKEIEKMEGMEDVNVFTDGLKIYTNLDPKAQEATETVLKNKLEGENKHLQSGVTLIDTQTGAIRAVGSGRGVKMSSYFASGIERQPGSTIKPVLDYGPAIENFQWNTGYILKDTPVEVNGATINNYNDRNVGDISMRQALVESKNTTAVRAFLEVGEDKALDFANKLGMNLDNAFPSYAIGGFNKGISPLKLAGSYAAFGNEGVYNKPTTIRKIVFADGEELKNESEPKAAMKDYTAYMITDMLKDVMTRGTGTKANVPSLNLAGKTGTTNFDKKTINETGMPSDATKDAWMAGYTTTYTAAVWTGYEQLKDGETKEPLYLDGRTQHFSKEIFRDIMSQINHKGTDFKKPSSVIEVALEKGSGKRASEFTPDEEKRYELFVKGANIPEVSDEYEKPAGIEGLEAKYEEKKNQIKVKWNYKGKKGVVFKVSASLDEGPMQELSTLKDKKFNVPNVIPGGSYTFQIIAVDEETGTASEPATTSITIPGEPAEPEQPEQPDTPPPGQEPGTPPPGQEPGTPPPGQEPGTPPPGQEPGTPPGDDDGGEGNGGDGGNGGQGSPVPGFPPFSQ